MDKFKPVKRVALDGKVWWVVWDNEKHDYTTLLELGGKYKTRKACQTAIIWYNQNR